MQISDIRINLLQNAGRLKALVSVTFENAFVVHGIKVIQGDKELFIAMPSKRCEDGGFRDVAHPIDSDLRSYMQKMILDKYDRMIGEKPPRSR